MKQNNNSKNKPRPARRPSAGYNTKSNTKSNYYTKRNPDFDRYNYVDDNSRDIYSNTNPRQNRSRVSVKRGSNYVIVDGKKYVPSETSVKRKKKSSAGKRAFKVLFSLVVICLMGGLIYGMSILSGLKRQNVDTKKYEQQPADAPTWSVADKNGISNILLIGADKNKDGSNGRSDTMMLVSIDPKDKKLRLVSFLRDTYLDIPTVGMNRLNSAFAHGGPALTMQTIENYYRINVDKFIQTDFNNFSRIIKQMGGVDVQLSKEEADYMNRVRHWHLKPGMQHLNSEEALYFARIRELDSDFGRTGRQRQLILCMMNTFKKKNILDMASIVKDYTPYIETNLSNKEIMDLASLGMQISSYKIETKHIPDNDMYKEDKKVVDGIPDQQVLVPNIEKNAAALRKFLYNENVDTN